ncbi:hypothetical protein ACF1AY_34270 [Streptomyces sp. NPDC014776]|uniref:hypothetical protein n=1 Tax=unclassified Streptomyces TaxID=2593676 RepID=UPI0036F60C70
MRWRAEAIVGAVTGSASTPDAAARPVDDQGGFQNVGRTTTLARATPAGVAGKPC